jgi:putative nucleotidyltransferase with HDIG domain
MALRIYVPLVSVVGAITLGVSATEAVSTPRPVAWLVLTGLALLCAWFRMAFASQSATVAVDDTFWIATTLFFGPGPASLAIALHGIAFSVRMRWPLRRVLFNGAAGAISMSLGGHVFFAIAGVEPPMAAPIGRLAAAVAHGRISLDFHWSRTASGAASGAQPASPVTIWHRHFRWLGVGYMGAASVAFCLVLLVQQGSLVAAAMVLPLLSVFHLTLQATFGRLDDSRRHLGDMDRLYLSTVETLAMAIDAKDDVTHNHVRRVQAYAVDLARALDITDKLTLKAIEAAALLHDTGKLAIPERILNKPGKLTESEFARMKEHVDIGADILSLVEFPYPVVPIVRGHHESWDGSGYPRGLRGADIPIGARILSVVDCFDALTSDRPYRRRMSDEDAIAILRERQGRMYDPAVVDTFVRVYRDIGVAGADAPGHREVMERVTQSRHDAGPRDVAPEVTANAPSSLLAFVSLSRVASGDASAADVLALSSRLLADIVPGATGAWFVPDGHRDGLVVADAFGPSAAALRGATVACGERLTGWVAANRQCIINSDAALDLGAKAETTSLQSCMSVPLLMGSRWSAC